jgi:hypothetical protein
METPLLGRGVSSGFALLRYQFFLAAIRYFEQNTIFATRSSFIDECAVRSKQEKKKPPVTGNVKGRQFELD